MKTKTRLTDAQVRRFKSPEKGQQDYYDHDVPGLSVRVSSKGTKTWSYMYRHVSKSKRLTLGRYPDLSIKDARQLARNAAVQVAQGVDPVFEKQRLRWEREREQDTTFENVSVRFMREYERGAAHFDNPENAKPAHRSWKDTQYYLDKHLLPQFGHRPLSEIMRSEVREFLASIATATPYQANNVFAIIRKMYNWAIDVDLVETSPCSGLKKPHRSVPRNKPLRDDDIRAFWASCESMGFPFGCAYRLLLVTGQRRNEVCMMTSHEIDFENREWILEAERTKAKRRHVVPITPLALDILGEFEHRESGFLFSTTDGVRPISGFSKTTNKLCISAELDEFRLHDLRATMATIMRERLGVSSDVIGQVLNHAPQGVTQRHYAATHSQDDMRNALEKWDGYLQRLVHDSEASNVLQFPGAG